jgi:lipoprotein-anchoring transpeptidase ErfK/SrfK
VTASGGTVDSVALTSTDKRPEKQKVEGKLADDKATWTASSLLEPGNTYTALISAQNTAGDMVTETRTFKTQALTSAQQVSIGSVTGSGSTVGVAMPVIVLFNSSVVDKASFEKNMFVTSVPEQKGSWRWISSTEAHWRPDVFWQPGTKVSVNLDINSVPAGNGRYGMESRTATLNIGRAAKISVDLKTHQLTQTVSGAVTRTIPISGGKAGFETRSGTKVIMERLQTVKMDAASTGTAKDDPEYYNLTVKYAMRVTWSGEYFHAAPWSVGSQGRANVSHGCVGMSTANAQWLMANSLVGDPAVYTGSNRFMTVDNGWGDWNLSAAEYAKGSALR